MVNLKKISCIIAAIIILISLSGCSNNERLTDMTVIQAVGIDCERGVVSVCIQYLDIDKGTGTNEGVKGNITAIAKGKGESIEKALSSLEKTLTDRLFFSQNKIIILGNNTEEELGNEIKKYISDNQRCRPDTLIVKSVSSAENVVKNPQRGSRVPSESLCQQLKRENAAFTANDYLNSYKENSLPSVEAKDDYTVVHK